MATQSAAPIDDTRPALLDNASAEFAARGWLAAASPALRNRILAAGRRVDLARGERLFLAGAPPGGVYGVIKGGVAIEGGTRWHSSRIGHVFRSGHWFGHGPALTGAARDNGYFAMEESLLLNVPLPALRALMNDDPDLTRLVGAMANMGTVLANWIVSDLLISDGPRRIAAVLLRVTGVHEGVEPSDPEGFLLTQGHLGEMANASRNSVNRALGQFARAGWIAKNYSHIRILDAPALSGFAYKCD